MPLRVLGAPLQAGCERERAGPPAAAVAPEMPGSGALLRRRTRTGWAFRVGGSREAWMGQAIPKASLNASSIRRMVLGGRARRHRAGRQSRL